MEMMLRGPVAWLPAVSLAAVLVGCRGAEKNGVEEAIDPIEASTVPGDKIYHEWKKIYSVDSHGSEGKTHVGFLDRRFSDSDPDGKLFVLDRKHETRGFLLPSGRAFVYSGSNPVARDLGNNGLENGVKKILEVAGGIEYELVRESSTSPATTR